jgi:4-methyl-5(b-hydroxyethyl)-thiazole monophosphate biosynthesis
MASVLVPIAQGCEELEAVTIIDLLRRAGIEVIVAGLDGGMVRASRGTVILPDTSLDQAMQRNYDMVVLPGGLPGADNLNQDSRIHDLLHKTSANNGYTAAICAAPKVLASAGLLEGKQATSFPGALDDMQVGGMKLVNSPVVKDGNVITSRGPGTAMDFALELIELLVGSSKREEVEAALQRP